MGSLANPGEELFLEHALDINRIATAGVNVQVGLSTANPLETGAGVAEPSLGYSRQTVNAWNTASGRKSENTNAISFGPAGAGGWGTISHWMIYWDESPSDILMFYGAFASGGRVVSEGDTATIPANELAMAWAAEDNETSISNYLANEILDHFLKTGDWNVPTTDTVYIGLWTSDLGDGSTGSSIGEVSGGGYSRVARDQATWTVSQSAPWEEAKNATSIQFGPASANWGTVTDIAVLDAASAGNILFYGQLATPRTINTDDTLTINGNDLKIRMQ